MIIFRSHLGSKTLICWAALWSARRLQAWCKVMAITHGLQLLRLQPALQIQVAPATPSQSSNSLQIHL